MKKYELKTTLLNNLEKNGYELIEKCIRRYGEKDYDLCIYFIKETGEIESGYIEDEYNFYRECTILCNFGHGDAIEFFMEFKDEHDFLLEKGETDIEDFEEWFENEFDFHDSNNDSLNIYYWIIDERIEELFPESEMEKEKHEEQKILMIKNLLWNEVYLYLKRYYKYDEDFDFDEDINKLSNQLIEYINNEIEKSENNKERIKRLSKYLQTINTIMND